MRQLIYGTVGNAVLLLAALAPIASSQEKPAADSEPAKIRFPSQPPPAPPAPPPPAPNGVDVLLADQLYVIDSDVELVVIPVPAGYVRASAAEAGPIRIRGKFVGGSGAPETKTFNGKFVYTVDYLAEGETTLMVIPVGFKNPSEVIQRRVRTGTAPQPPPNPDDPVDPPQPDGKNTSPFKEPGFRVLISFDSKETTRPPGWQSIITGKAVRDYLEAHCVPNAVGEKDDTGGVMKEYRIYPDDSDLKNVRQVWRDAWAKRGGKDWILIGDGKKGYSGPLPATAEETLTLLRKYGGQ